MEVAKIGQYYTMRDMLRCLLFILRVFDLCHFVPIAIYDVVYCLNFTWLITQSFLQFTVSMNNLSIKLTSEQSDIFRAQRHSKISLCFTRKTFLHDALPISVRTNLSAIFA